MRGVQIQPNSLLNIIGLLLVLAALAGGVTYVEPSAGGPVARSFSASFTRDQGTGPVAHGDTPDTQAGSAVVILNITNLTSAAFSFTFTDNYRFAAVSPAGATFRVTSPEGNVSEAVCPPGGPTSATVQFSMINTPPMDMVIVAGSQAAAAQDASARNPACETGSGDWSVEVTVQRDFATPVRLPGGSITWSLTTRVEWYSLQVTELLSA